jgi:hypothetical protein
MNLKELVQKVSRKYDRLVTESQEASFIWHNKKVWADFQSDEKQGEILLEASKTASSIISFSYLANLLAKKHGAKIKAYVVKDKKTKTTIYESFNAEVFYFSLSGSQVLEVEKLFNEIYPNIKTKRDVEDLKVKGVWIGDLLYDSHLRDWLVPTVDIKDWRFQKSLKGALGYYIYWRDYLDLHNVKAVIVSHCVYYQYAVVLRLAIQSGIPGYQINATHAHRLNNENLRAYTEFFDFPARFRKLTSQEQRAGLEEAKRRIERRLAGEVGVDMHYSSQSAFVRKENKRVLRESPRIKVLIAVHCFFDAPHPYGKNLFPDLYEWMTFLGQISEKTDYDWYLKTHPDYLPENTPILEQFLNKYRKLTKIDHQTSHLRLADDGLDFVLTVYGTVGFEYAVLGVPVINASTCNPHIGYKFNIHPRTVDEYEKILLNLHNQKLDIDVNQVYEYYYMRFINNTDNWLFGRYSDFLKEIGGYKKQVGSISYKKFLEQFSPQKHLQILRSLDKFVESKGYCFQKEHLASA